MISPEFDELLVEQLRKQPEEHRIDGLIDALNATARMWQDVLRKPEEKTR